LALICELCGHKALSMHYDQPDRPCTVVDKWAKWTKAKVQAGECTCDRPRVVCHGQCHCIVTCAGQSQSVNIATPSGCLLAVTQYSDTETP